MQNAKQIWKETAKQLQKVYDQREAESISYLLLEDVFAVDRSDIVAEIPKTVDSDRLEGLIVRLLNNEPIQYVTGIADFFGRKFRLTQGALIPRPETEELCELIIQENKSRHPKILDVGLGSGCIAITLAKELNGEVFGTDVSETAIEIARNNASLLKAKVLFVQGNVLTEDLPAGNLDILVSNPPYIPIKDQAEMGKNVLQFEPEEALFVPDDDPILFYRRIADLGLESLKTGGKLYFEIHERFGSEVKSYLEKTGYSDVKVHQDMQGKNRMISAINSTNR